MAGIPVHPRSVSDATRFTQTTPHATSSADVQQTAAATSQSPGSSARPTSSRFQSPAAARPSGGSGGGSGGGPSGPSPFGETPAQRVARLRAAHKAAKSLEVSALDRLLDRARGVLDSAHRMTVVGLIGFTVIATVLTAYTTVDMLRFNRKRKAEFFAAQRQIEEDSLEAARLAYMQNKATPEQTAMVEEAMEEAERSGKKEAGGIFGVPSLLGAPAPVVSTGGSSDKANTTEAEAAAKRAAVQSWVASTLTREEEGERAGSSQRRLGYESLSEEDDAQGARESDVVRAVEDRQSYLAAKAGAARAGAATPAAPAPAPASTSTKSWWQFW